MSVCEIAYHVVLICTMPLTLLFRSILCDTAKASTCSLQHKVVLFFGSSDVCNVTQIGGPYTKQVLEVTSLDKKAVWLIKGCQTLGSVTVTMLR